MNAPAIRPGEKLCCVIPLKDSVRRGVIYTAAEVQSFGSRSALIELEEFPERLFHPKRFVRVVQP